MKRLIGILLLVGTVAIAGCSSAPRALSDQEARAALHGRKPTQKEQIIIDEMRQKWQASRKVASN